MTKTTATAKALANAETVPPKACLAFALAVLLRVLRDLRVKQFREHIVEKNCQQLC
jgi:hypothetical protein